MTAYHPRAFPWQDWLPRLKELIYEGDSARDMAEILSRESKRRVSRNAVIGKLHREGLWPSPESIMSCANGGLKEVKPPKPAPKRPNRMVKIGAIFVPRVALAPALEQRRAAAAAIASPPSVVMEPETQSARCTIMDLTHDRCRWIVGDERKPLEAVYCGGRTSKRPWGKVICPYCDWHAEMAVSKRAA